MSKHKQTNIFRTVYTQKAKHRKQCPVCNRLIADGERAVGQKRRSVKWYPVKGNMTFVSWRFWHEACYDECLREEIE